MLLVCCRCVALLVCCVFLVFCWCGLVLSFVLLVCCVGKVERGVGIVEVVWGVWEREDVKPSPSVADPDDS